LRKSLIFNKLQNQISKTRERLPIILYLFGNKGTSSQLIIIQIKFILGVSFSSVAISFHPRFWKDLISALFSMTICSLDNSRFNNFYSSSIGVVFYIRLVRKPYKILHILPSISFFGKIGKLFCGFPNKSLVTGDYWNATNQGDCLSIIGGHQEQVYLYGKRSIYPPLSDLLIKLSLAVFTSCGKQEKL